MRIPSDNSNQPHAPRPGVLQVLALKAGQTVNAKVTGQTPQGQTQVQINGQQINLALPVNVQVGEVLQFQVKAGGAVPELVLINSAGEQNGHRAPAQPQNQNPNQSQSQTQSQSQGQPPPQQSPPTPSAPQPPTGQVPLLQVSLPQSGHPPPAPAPSAPVASASTNSSPVPGAPPGPTGQPAQTSIPLPQAVQTNLGLQPGQLVTAQVSPPVAGGTAQITIGTQQIPANLPGNLPSGAVLNFQVEGVGANARLVLVGQSTPTQPANVLSSTPQNSGAAPAHPAPGAPPTSTALPPPATMQEAITQTAATAVVRQDSVSALISNLAGLKSSGTEFPPQVAAAASQLLAKPINLGSHAPPAAALQTAVVQSGVFLEAMVAQGQTAAAQADVKAILFLLRGSLSGWLGSDTETILPNGKRPPPPMRGTAPRTPASNQPPQADPGSLRDMVRQLLAQTESALSRVQLFQLSSLPEAAGRANPGTAPGEWNLEIPFMLGGDLSMAQFQILRDGGQDTDPSERGWHMAFSINLTAVGEVGAKVSHHIGKTGVMLWAENEETAHMLEKMLPELVSSLQAIGLSPGAVRVRHGTPENHTPPSGGFMDAIS